MTSITLIVTGASIRSEVNGILTSGMVGIPVTIQYDNAWNGLTKNFVCRCGKWGADSGEIRTILGIGETATVAHEVMQADKRLYLGVEGYSADGKLVIPTTWADCGLILPGANAGADPSTDPELSVWAQLQGEIEQIRQDTVTEEDIAAAVAAYMEENSIEIPDSSQNGNGLSDTAKTLLITILRSGVYGTDQSANITALETALGSSGESGDEENPHTHSYTAHVTREATCTAAGLRTYTCSCGESYTEEIPATGHSYMDGVCTACGAADPNYNLGVILTGITATYSGGDVPVGTAVTDLTGVVVTALYSDGSTETVTGYTLNGTTVEGSNIVTVTYEGMTTTFTVTGVAESSGNTPTLLYNWDFTQSLTDTVAGNTAVLNGDGTTQDNNGIALSQAESTSTNYVSFAENIHGANRRYEIDIVSFDSTDGTDRFNNFLFSIGLLTGFSFMSKKWQFYTGHGWAFIDTGNADISIFNGKTAVIEINADYSWTVYADDTLICESNTPMYTDQNGASSNVITLGSNGGNSAYTDMIITGLRIYNLGGV